MRGRSVVYLLLLGFVVLASGVIVRRTYGVRRAREIVKLESTRAALMAQRAKLDRDIRESVSMDRLGRVAEERLHMRVPSDSIVVTLERPAPASHAAVR
jgi:cell division protein FtsL